MKNIAFVSIGDESHNCADLLVKSIKKTNSNCRIIQISNKEDRNISDIDEKIIFDFKSATFMFNRLESQIAVLEKFGPFIQALDLYLLTYMYSQSSSFSFGYKSILLSRKKLSEIDLLYTLNLSLQNSLPNSSK